MNIYTLRCDLILIEKIATFDTLGLHNDSVVVVFGFDKEVQRNKYRFVKVGDLTEEESEQLTMDNYRGHVLLKDQPCTIPLFTMDFKYPLYRVLVSNSIINKEGGVEYEVIESPMAFKLKGKEDMLGYSVTIKRFRDVTNIANDEPYATFTKKAYRIPVNTK